MLCSRQHISSGRIFSIFRTKLKLPKNNFSKHVVSCPSPDIIIPDVNITEWVYSKMEKFSEYTAVECVETGKKYTFEEVRVKAGNLARSLRKNWGLQRGDVVAIYSTNCPEYFVACMGILEAGLVITTINSSYKVDEISKQLIDASAKVIITQPQLFDEAKKACLKIKKDIPVISTKIRENESLPGGAVNFEELINSNIDLPPVKPRNPDDLAFLPYSSGTTGLPKGVRISHRNLVAENCLATHPDYTFIEPPSANHQETVPGILPMFHIYGFALIQLNGLTTGNKLLTFPKFTPEMFITTLKNNKITMLYTVPPLVLFLTNHPGVKTENLAHLKSVLCGAAPLGASEEQKFKQKVGRPIPIFQGYGLTESTGIVTSLGSKKFVDHLEKYSGSSGPPAVNTLVKIVKIEDDSGEALGPNESGEILTKGPQMMQGYLNRPEENERAFLDGWFRTGDIGYCDDNGMLYVTDRLKELIKVKGLQVAPAELEELIRDFPAVQDAAVIGVPHPLYGEVPRAYVVRKVNEKVNPEDVQKYIADKVAKHKHLLGGVEVVETIPKTASGKTMRKQLKQDYQEKFG